MSKCRLFVTLIGLSFLVNLALATGAFPSALRSSLASHRNVTSAWTWLNLALNNPPVAVDDAYTTHGNLNVPGNGIIANDWDPDGNQIHLESCTQPGHGTTTCTAYNSFTYRPEMGFAGSDSFTYQVCDSFSACATGTVSLTVINTPPVAVADVYIWQGGLVVPGPNALRENDYDPDGDSRGVKSYTQPQHGLANYSHTYGTLSYLPSNGYRGSDTFTYELCDPLGMCSTGTVYILVLPGSATPPKEPYACCPIDPAGSHSLRQQRSAYPGNFNAERWVY
jgi:large repetitive protein